jgi:alpha-tubulin suppressor-like RCC1 family protein
MVRDAMSSEHVDEQCVSEQRTADGGGARVAWARRRGLALAGLVAVGVGLAGVGLAPGPGAGVVAASAADAGQVVFAKVAAGSSHSLGVTASGRLFGTGNNGSGQLGVGSTTSQETMALAASWPGIGSDKVVQIAAGSSHSLALTSGGKV